MISKPQPGSLNILAGTSELIDEQLRSGGIKQSHTTKTACQRVSGRVLPFNEANLLALLKAMYARIEVNWKERKRPISLENWRWEPRPTFAPRNSSREVTLERSIIRAGKERPWVNQVPTSSGLYTAHTDRTRNVDLVFERSRNVYEFVELKVDSNYPLYAAFEIVRNALLFLFTRRLGASGVHIPKGDRNLLLAEAIELVVLAPSEYYSSFDLSFFEQKLNAAISKYAASEFGMKMSFRFESFPSGFRWVPEIEQTDQTATTLLAAVGARRSVVWRR